MLIRKIAISEIKTAAYNPRKNLQPGHPEYENLKRSIEEFGFLELLVFNVRTNTLVSGHQRMKVLVQQGAKEVEASIVDLPLEKEKQLNLILNRVRGDWEEDKLGALLEEFASLPDFDLTSTGFNLAEISEILDERKNNKEDDCDFNGDVASIDVPVTQKGDLIELGRHKLLCGDATNPEDLKKLMGDEKADIFDCDWPYNVNLNGGENPRTDTRPKKSRKWKTIYSDNLPQNEYEEFMRKVLSNVKTHLRPGAAFYQWQAHRQLGPLYQILVEKDFYPASLICWAKEAAVISYADYSFQTEQAVYGWLKNAPHYFAGKPGESNLWQVHRDPTKTYSHPCQKPVELAERAIKNSSKRGEIVLDVFLGSGSVLLGAERLERRCYGLELSSEFCDAIVRRFIAFCPEKVSKSIKLRYQKVA